MNIPVNKRLWKPITLARLLELSDEQRNFLLSVCWKNGEPRCETVGISDLRVSPTDTSGYKVAWSDNDGDPHIIVASMNSPIDHIGDGTWSYALYERVARPKKERSEKQVLISKARTYALRHNYLDLQQGIPELMANFCQKILEEERKKEKPTDFPPLTSLI